MQETLPIALHVSPDGYYLVDENGVSFHGNSELEPLYVHKNIWCLSNSHGSLPTTRVPTEDFIRTPTAKIIQAASPHSNRWHDWVKETEAQLYVMDIWDDGELALLADLLGGANYVSKVFDLASEWGPSPRNLVKALNNAPRKWENNLRRAINTAAAQFAQNPQRALSDVTTLTHESIASSVVWMRPKHRIENREDYEAYVPNAARIVNAVRHALQTRSSEELAYHFDTLSRNSCSHNIAGYVFESLTHATITSGFQTFTWYALDVLPEDVGVPTVTFDQVISGQQELSTTNPPFYYCPALANYPGIDGALCTGKNVYVIQATLSTKYTSTVGGLRKLYNELQSDRRPPRRNWCLLFASSKQEVGRCLAEAHSEAIQDDPEWGDINIGYFTPLRMQEFGSSMNFNEKGVAY